MTKINDILSEWIPGDVHTLGWFKQKKVGQRLAYQYSESKSLRKIGPGVYSRTKDKPHWMGGVRLLQEELKYSIHVAGLSALELQGQAHFINLGRSNIYLLSYHQKVLPSWFKNINWGVDFVLRKSSLFSADYYLHLYKEKDQRGFKFKISSRELAVFEFIDSLDFTHSFETAENYMNGLHTLRPEVMQDLLEKCRSVKVKRVVLYLSEKLNLPFFKKIKFKKLDLGRGKRVIVKKGKLDSKYQITVPIPIEESPF